MKGPIFLFANTKVHKIYQKSDCISKKHGVSINMIISLATLLIQQQRCLDKIIHNS